MNENPLAAIQPDATPVEPVVAPVVEPVAPVIEPPAAPVNPSGEDGKLTEEDKAEADEWDKATDELFPGLKKAEEKKENEPNEPKEEPKTPEAPKTGEEKPEPPKPDGEGSQEDASKEGGEAGENEPTDANARLTAREQQAAIDAVKADVREKMFADVPTELKDADGDPIKSVADVMRLNNPNTGAPFTQEEATAWFTAAKEAVKEKAAEVAQQVEQITDTNLNLKDQADVINFRFGELLKAMPELRDKLWGEYEKTLSKDSKSGIIIKAPVSLQQFYETALEPYAEMGRQLEAQQNTDAENKAKAEADAKAAEEVKKTQTRQDRSDIYGRGKVDTATEDDKEWSAAAEAVFGPRN